ncbi:MAG: GTP-binding protein, partial [Gemmatimonadales bacterium]
DEIRAALQYEFQHADVLAVSTRAGVNLDAWFRRITFGEQRWRPAMAVDYDRYADGEQRLGWLNATVHAGAPAAADGNLLLQQLASDLRSRLSARGAMVAHLKMTLGAGGNIAAINLVRNDVVPELGVQMNAPVTEADLVVNLRAEAAPKTLEASLRESLAAIDGRPAGWHLDLVHAEAFRPGRPEPTYRDGVTPPST